MTTLAGFVTLFIHLLIIYVFICQLIHKLFSSAHVKGRITESVHRTHAAAPMSLLELEIIIKRNRTLDLIPQNTTHRGSVSSVNSANSTLTSAATAIPYSTFTVRVQKRAGIQCDVARLAQHTLQKNLPSK